MENLFEAKEEREMKKIGICNNKGGVGKTTFCFCLGGALAEVIEDLINDFKGR